MAINFPNSPTNGDVHIEGNTTFQFNGDAWRKLGGFYVIISETTPTGGIAPGQLWFNSNTAQLLVYYDDGNSTQWVSVVPGTLPPSSVELTGTPVDNQIAIWTDDHTVEGDANFTWDGSTLNVTGDITVSGTVDGVDMADVVTKVGTPVDNQIGVWTGDGTIEGDTNLTWDGSIFTVGGTDAIQLPVGTTAQQPSGSDGMLRYNSTLNTFEGYSNGVWGEIAGGGGSVTISDTAPGTPDDGDLWFDSANLVLYIYYDDGSSSQWVSTQAGGQTGSWTNDGSQIYYDGGLNVGIGTATPSEKLDVDGNIAVTGTVDGVDMADVVTKVGTPADNQIGVWTGDGTIEGDSNLTWDGSVLTVGNTGAVQMPTGTTAQRPGTPATGMIRYNTDDEQFEGYDSNTTWQNLGPKAYFSAYDGTGNTNVTSGAVVTIDTQFAVSNSALFTLSSNVITINKTATYMITLDISTRVLSGSNRSESRGYLQRDTGSGFTTVTGTSVMMYNRDSTQGDNTGSATIIISLNSGDQLRLFAERQSGGDTIETLPNASRITLLEV